MAYSPGELLLRGGALTAGQLRQALDRRAREGGSLGESVVALGFRSEEELAALYQKRLVLPRVTGMLLASVVLAVYLASTAMLTAALMTSGPNAFTDLRLLGDVLPLGDMLEGLAKTAVFGLVVAVIACRAGLRAGHAMTEIPRAASRAVVGSLLAVFLIDAFWGLV